MRNSFKLDFKPSKYQQDFFEWVQHGVGNAVISATAGSAKTTTAVTSIKFIQKSQKCLFIAFNKTITEELKILLKKQTNTDVKTTHSLGLLMLKRNFDTNIKIDENKYRKFIKDNIFDLFREFDNLKTDEEINTSINNITTLIDFARFNLAHNEKEIQSIAHKYNIPVSLNECTIVKKCLEWGKTTISSVDYTDMIWLPVELYLQPIGLTYDWVYIDECQDLSKCSIQLFLKTIKRGGRFVAVGDANQTINIFAGSDEESFNYLINIPNTKCFDLPITYRCGKKIVNYVQMFVPHITACDDAIEGEILSDCSLDIINENDMVLCRTQAPLIQLYIQLIQKKINCYIKGIDIKQYLINEINNFEQEDLNVKLDKDGLFVRLWNNLFNERNKLMEYGGIDYEDATLSNYIMEKYDIIKIITLLSKKYKKKSELIKFINEVFQEQNEGVCLSTIHKAKGLECDKVYILCPSSMPSKLAKQKWEKLQEQNLMFVAYTRAKKVLGFISEKEFKPFGMSKKPKQILKDLSEIEEKVCKVLNKEPMKQLKNIDLLRFKVQNMTEIDTTPQINNKNCLIKEDETTTTDDILLAELEGLL